VKIAYIYIYILELGYTDTKIKNKKTHIIVKSIHSSAYSETKNKNNFFLYYMQVNINYKEKKFKNID